MVLCRRNYIFWVHRRTFLDGINVFRYRVASVKSKSRLRCDDVLFDEFVHLEAVLSLSHLAHDLGQLVVGTEEPSVRRILQVVPPDVPPDSLDNLRPTAFSDLDYVEESIIHLNHFGDPTIVLLLLPGTPFPGITAFGFSYLRLRPSAGGRHFLPLGTDDFSYATHATCPKNIQKEKVVLKN